MMDNNNHYYTEVINNGFSRKMSIKVMNNF